MAKRPSPKAFLNTIAKGASAVGGTDYAWRHRRESYFHPLKDVPVMLRDPRLSLCSRYIKGTVRALTRFYVDEGSGDGTGSEIKQFVIDQIHRWWNYGVAKQMRAIDYGYYAAEAMYRVVRGDVCFCHFKSQRLDRVVPYEVEGSVVGFTVGHVDGNEVFLAIPKALWSVHGREHDDIFGESRYAAAFVPWNELRSTQGAIDIRRMNFYNEAIGNRVLYFPEGSQQTESGQLKSNKDTANELLSRARSGASLALPSTTDQHGMREWELDRREGSGVAAEIMDYVESLQNEMTEGTGTPTEVLRSSETGSGFSGRAIPMTAFQGLLSEVASFLINDFDEQVIRPLVTLKFGVEEPEYQVIPFGLVPDDAGQPEVATVPGQGIPNPVADKARQSKFSSLLVF